MQETKIEPSPPKALIKQVKQDKISAYLKHSVYDSLNKLDKLE